MWCREIRKFCPISEFRSLNAVFDPILTLNRSLQSLERWLSDPSFQALCGYEEIKTMQNTRVLKTPKCIQNPDKISIGVPFYSVSNASSPFELFVEQDFFKTAK